MANTASPSKSLSTAAVQPQDRMFNSDREQFVSLFLPGTGPEEIVTFDIPGTDPEEEVRIQFTPGTGSLQRNLALGRKVEITSVVVTNNNVAMAAATNTTAISVDSEDGAGTKTHDIADKAAGTAIAADALLSLTLTGSAGDATRIVEATEIIRIDSTVVGTQGSFDVSIRYRPIDQAKQVNWAPGRKVEVTAVIVTNNDVAMAATVNTTAINVDSEDGAGAKTHDICAKAAGTALAADALSSLALTGSAGDATRVIESTEILRIDNTMVGIQGAFSVSVVYRPVDQTKQVNWAPGRSVRISRVVLANADVAIAATVNTSAINVDIEDGAGAKTHDVCTKAAGTAVAAHALLSLTLSTTEADLVVESTELVRVDNVVVGVQGDCVVTIGYVDLAVTQLSVDWANSP